MLHFHIKYGDITLFMGLSHGFVAPYAKDKIICLPLPLK